MFKRPKQVHQNKTPEDWQKQLEGSRLKFKEKSDLNESKRYGKKDNYS